jgi:OPA family glycerol-3-phosphate transporter-like MFS transporter
MKKKLSASGGLIFLVWLVYATSYLGKVNYSANITQIVTHFGVSKSEAGLVPTMFFFAYGAGQVINGLLCKHYPIRWMIPGSLLVSATINLIVGLTPNFAIIKWLWMVNGFALSVLWPCLIRLSSESFSQKSLGKSVVAWGTTVASGTLVIYGLSSIFATFNGFRLAFFTAAIADGAVAVFWFFRFKALQNRALAEKNSEVLPENARQDQNQ